MTKINFAAEFELMRPYRDDEVGQAIKRLVNYPEFDYVLQYLYPDKPLDQIKNFLLEIENVAQFQKRFMHHAVSYIVNHTSAGLTVSGQEYLRPGKAYLFISNHRDIVLDAAILQVILLDNNHKTSQITFGSNLMKKQFVIDFGRLNRMFKFYRGGTRLEVFKHAIIHSSYIRNAIVDMEESVWIAQSNGRTKDGNDATQTALIKMLAGSNPDPEQALRQLNIVPIAVSYEYEPCDVYKVRENYLALSGSYMKDKNEDFMSILSGITSPKGRIHFAFGKPINDIPGAFGDADSSKENIFKKVTKLIDRQIHTSYKLWPTNYIASDLLSGQSGFSDKYSIEKAEKLQHYIENKLNSLKGDQATLRKLFLQLYARPVENRKKQ